jgi:hypothetical protein
LVEKYKIPTPLPKPKDLGKDLLGRGIGEYSPKEYSLWKERGDKLELLKSASQGFRIRYRGFREEKERERKGDLDSEGKEGQGKEERAITEEELEEERARRRQIGQLRGKGTSSIRIVKPN